MKDALAQRDGVRGDTQAWAYARTESGKCSVKSQCQPRMRRQNGRGEAGG